MSPRISVVLPAWNHERFVVEAVVSALGQDREPFEVVVCDDASTDGTLDALRAIRDPRVRVIASPANEGPAAAARHALDAASGDYIARLCSDDVCLPGRLRRQAAWLDEHPECAAVLALPEFIDAAGQVIEAPPHLAGVFSAENRSRGAWLRHFFARGNALCMPSAMIRRSVFAEVAPPRVVFRHLPDLDFWVRFCCRFDFHVLPEKLVGFRILPDAANVSSPTPERSAAAEIERLTIWRRLAEDDALAAMGLSTGPEGRLALAEEACRLGGRTRLLFALQILMETDTDHLSPDDRSRFLRGAAPLLAGNDALGVLERRRLREERDRWRERHRRAAAKSPSAIVNGLRRWFRGA